jgi:hypothetical protein
MSKKDTGGPAFRAGERYELKEGWRLEEGMTLRDYFAAKAMQGWMANPTATPVEAGIDDADPKAMADVAAMFGYMVADAMLRAREAGNV